MKWIKNIGEWQAVLNEQAQVKDRRNKCRSDNIHERNQVF